jgi:hypothetical protein
MRRARLGLGLGLAAAAAAVLAAGLAGGWWRSGAHVPRPAKPVVATAWLSAGTPDFGDTLGARLDVLVDPSRADPSSVRVRPRFAPYRIAATSLRSRRAGSVLLSYSYTLDCLTAACVPDRAQVERRFLPALVSYRTRSSLLRRRVVDWPSFTVASSLTDVDRRDPTERLRVDTTLPAVTYRISPGTLQALLAALSGALVLLAAGLVAVAFRRPGERPAPAEPELPALDRALLSVRASTANGFPAERRKALGWLARELRSSGRGDLAGDAARLAWSTETPSAEATGTFAARVEASLGVGA